MNKKTWLRMRIELLVAVAVLLILLTVMIPRFLGAQRKYRYKHLQRFIDTVMVELVKDDAAIVKAIVNGTAYHGLHQSSNVSEMGAITSRNRPDVNTFTNLHVIRKSGFETILDGVPLPYLSNDLHFGEPVFYLSVKTLERKNETPVIFFGLHAALFDSNRPYAEPWNLPNVPSPRVGFDNDNNFQPLCENVSGFLYHPSNGVESGGIVYRDSYSAGWRVPSGTGPVIDHLKQYSP